MNEKRSGSDELTEQKALLEAAFFLAEEALDRKAIKDILGTSSDQIVDAVLDYFRDELNRKSRGIELVESEGRYRFQVKGKFLDKVSHLAPYQEISDTVLQTLSIIAYNHPALQKDVIKVRGKCAYSHIKELIQRGLVKAEDAGRTKSLEVTDQFLEYFGLDSPEEFRMHVSSGG